MSRLFDGTNDVMAYGSVPSSIAVDGAHTLLIVTRILDTSETVWLSFVETLTSGAAAAATMGRSANGNIYWSGGGGFNQAVACDDSDNWVVAAITKAAGSSTPRAHKIVLATNTPTHTDFPGNEPASASITGGTIYLGGGPSGDYGNQRIAAAAIFNKVLSDAEINGIGTAKTTASIYALGPTWLVDDNDAFASDYMGHANRTAITDTADDADDPAGWVYGVGSDVNVTGVSAQVTASGPQPLVSTLTRPYTLVTIS